MGVTHEFRQTQTTDIPGDCSAGPTVSDWRTEGDARTGYCDNRRNNCSGDEGVGK